MNPNPILRLSLGVALAFAAVQAPALDNNIDPFNLGKGDWIYYLSQATNKLGGNVPSVTSVSTLMSYEKSKGMSFIAIKAGTGSTNFPSDASPQVTSSVISAAHTAGLKIFAYTRSHGTNIAGEIQLATNYLAMGCDGFIIDAEDEWETAKIGTVGPERAVQLCQGIKAVFPNKFLGHSPFVYITSHNSFPYKEFGYYCDAIMPQMYWYDFGISAIQGAVDLNTQWNNWHNTLTGTWTNAIKPIAPAACAYNTAMPATEITNFVHALKTNVPCATWAGYKGISYWRADLHTGAQWTNGITVAAIGSSNAPVISGIAAGDLLDTSALISFNTDISGDTVVEYGLTTSYGSTVSNGNMVAFHKIGLTGLTPSTTYNYRVKSKNFAGQTSTSTNNTFATLAWGQVNDIIVDNPQATMVGTWTVGTSATDKYGSDYRYKGQGTGAAYLQFAPKILRAGYYNIYEWHSQGSNRGVDTPHTIYYNGGNITVAINQQINGGKWNLIGEFNMAAGENGSVKISDAISTSGQLAMADGIKFQYVPLPAAPGGLTATAISSSQINLAWTDNSANETGFIIARATASGGPYTDIASLAANTTSYSNTGLSANTTYYYVVRASNQNGSSQNSAIASAATPLPPVPAAPSGLTATTISASQINLAWVDNSDDETGFRVERSTDGVNFTQFVSLSANVTSTSDTGLAQNTLYYYRVRAYNAGGNSAYSAVASATTLPTPPAAPSALAAAVISQTQINLTWTDNSANETGFVVARATVSGGPYTDIATLGANTTSYSNTGLSANTAYYYVVRAYNAGGASANSAQATATTLPNPPAAPSGLAATALSPTSIRLTWTDNSANETSFIVARATVSGGPYTDIATLGANVTTYTNTSLAPSTTYYYVVRASNSGGSSVNSAQASATTQPVADIIIDNTAATVTGTWSAGTSATDKYSTNYVYKSKGTGTAYLTFTPSIQVAGNYQVYEWHPAGSNRPTNAPVVISYNGGSRTNRINQTVSGGTWIACGTPVNFAVGTAGYVRIRDDITETNKSVMADAIKFVYVP